MKLQKIFEQSVQRVNFEDVLSCPECGEEYNHPAMTIVCHGNDDTFVTGTCVNANGDTIERLKKVQSCFRARGGETIIVYDCEEGHRWAQVLHFHKGRAFVDQVFLHHLPVGPDTEVASDRPDPEQGAPAPDVRYHDCFSCEMCSRSF